MTERVLRHSKWDALLVALSFAHGGALFAVPSIPVIALGLWWNSNTVAHNFIHVLEICDRVNLLQHGKITFDMATAETSAEQLTDLVAAEYRATKKAKPV